MSDSAFASPDAAAADAFMPSVPSVDPRVAHQDTSSATAPGNTSASATQNTNAGGSTVGYQAQAGTGPTVNGQANVGGWNMNGSASAAPTASGGVGSYKDASGNQVYGADGNATTVGAQGSATKQVGSTTVTANGDVQGPSAQAGASVTQKGDMNYAHVGGEANAASGSVSVGTQDPSSSSNEQMRAGVSAGVGLDARAQWGTDANGNIRVGGGLDVGPASVDVSTNDPVRTALGFVAGGGLPASLNPLNPMNYVDTDDKGKQENMTNQVMNAVSNGASQVSQTASSAVNTAGQAASDLWGWVTG